MSISCACDVDYEMHEDSWAYRHKKEFQKLKTKRRQRCRSCRELIDVGDDCGILNRSRLARSDIEERIHGDEVEIASWYLCETCYGLMLSVEAAGGCVLITDGENLKDAIIEWREEYPNGCGP